MNNFLSISIEPIVSHICMFSLPTIIPRLTPSINSNSHFRHNCLFSLQVIIPHSHSQIQFLYSLAFWLPVLSSHSQLSLPVVIPCYHFLFLLHPLWFFVCVFIFTCNSSFWYFMMKLSRIFVRIEKSLKNEMKTFMPFDLWMCFISWDNTDYYIHL